jgi:pyruvate dehydrogenase E2 component (dihydrolipoamide acetyltransferase)
VTLESDKATMDVPSAMAGITREVLLKRGDLVSVGPPVAYIEFGDMPGRNRQRSRGNAGGRTNSGVASEMGKYLPSSLSRG